MAGEIADVTRLVEATLGRRVRSLAPLGHGSDHRAYAVDGELVARLAADPEADAAIASEVRTLEVAAEVSPIPVPEVVAVDAGVGLTIVRRLEGTSLLDRPCPEPERLVDQLASFLAGLLGVDEGRLQPVVPIDREPLATYLDEARASYPRVAHVLSGPHALLVERFLEAPTPPEATRLAFCHGDLGAEHLLAGTDRLVLTGVIDWSDAAITDPARDLGRLSRDLGRPTVEAVVEDLALDADEVLPRARFHACCSLLEDLDYGLRSGDRRYADAALANLSRTFGATSS